MVEDPGSLRELIDELHHKAALFLVQNLDIIILLSVWTEGLLFIWLIMSRLKGSGGGSRDGSTGVGTRYRTHHAGGV